MKPCSCWLDHGKDRESVAKLNLYAKIAKSEKDIDEGKGMDAFEALDAIRKEFDV